MPTSPDLPQPCTPPAPRGHQPLPPQAAPHWELGGPGSEGDLSGESSRFNESWPSTEASMEQPSEKPGGGEGEGEEEGEGEKEGEEEGATGEREKNRERDLTFPSMYI